MSFIVKNTTLLNPLNLIAPHSCRGCGALGEVLCRRCKNNIILSHANFQSNFNARDLPEIMIVSRYDTLLGDLIRDFKYNSTRAIGVKLAEILDQTLPKVKGPVNIVPLPTISRHVRARGLDHTLFIAKRLAKLRGCQVTPILERKTNSVQVGADRKTRLAQAESAYTLRKNAKIDPATTYLLFDDILTTGASMKAGLKKLQQAGASKIILVVLAQS